MVKDESGNVLSKDDRVKLSFAKRANCFGRIESIHFDRRARGSKAKTGYMLVRSEWIVDLNDIDTSISGIAKIPAELFEDYKSGPVPTAKGVAPVRRVAAVKAKRRA